MSIGKGFCGDCEQWTKVGVAAHKETGWCTHPAVGRITTAAQGCPLYVRLSTSRKSLENFDMNIALESLSRVHEGKDPAKPTNPAMRGPAFVPLDEMRRKAAARLGRRVA